MTTRFQHLRAAIVRTPWAIMPDRLEAIAEVVERRVEGIRLTPEEIAGIKGPRVINGSLGFWSRSGGLTHVALAADASPQANVIAVINVFGIIAQHAAEVDDISGPGGTSTERVTSSFRAALNDPSVKAIVLNVNSPGGNVYGVQALGDEIFKARGQKPIVAQANSLTASAAYWIASQADEIVITPGGQVGSIGVYALHEDDSKMLDAVGIKFTFISAGKYKVEGNSFEPLGDEAAKAIQKDVDAYYRDFTTAVARGRGVKAGEVVNGFGEGRVEKDKDAVALGMADRVATLDDTLRRLSSKRAAASSKADVIEKPAEASAISIEKTTAEGSEQLSVVGEFPAVAAIAGDFLDADSLRGVSVSDDGSTVTVALANGSASYKLRGMTADGEWIGDLVPPAAAAEDDAGDHREDTDAFRRRRHAHRMRGGR